MGDLGNSLDLPFEEGGQGPLTDPHVHFSGGLVVNDQMAKLRPLLMEAIATARRGAQR